jgi:very-short-patch-repair endonuclease
MDIIIKGTKEEPLYGANDIAKILGIGNIRMSIQYFDNTEKCSIYIMDRMGRNQLTSFLTTKGLKKFICRSRKPSAIDFAIKLGIEVYDIMHVPLETSVIKFITTVFSDEEYSLQHSVGKYKIDLYFPKYKIAVECDEYFHNFKEEEDKERENFIKKDLNCEFIRFKQGTDLALIIKILKDKIEDKKYNVYRWEITELNTKLDNYDYDNDYGEWYVKEYELDKIGYKPIRENE